MLVKTADFVIGPVFDAVDIGLVLLDNQQCIVGWNEWIARVSRLSAEDVLGKNLCDVFTDLRSGRLPDVIDDAFQVGSSSILTHALNALLPLQGEGGERLLHNIVVRPVVSVSAKYCLLQITDVTTAVSRERLLRERQNARYYAIVDSAPDAIIKCPFAYSSQDFCPSRDAHCGVGCRPIQERKHGAFRSLHRSLACRQT
jgi:PAS domain S-box-containing protein